MKKIFILGASSDVGINVTELFLKSGWHVTAHYNKSNKKLNEGIDEIQEKFPNKIKFTDALKCISFRK